MFNKKIVIVPDLYIFFEYIHENGIEAGKQSFHYKLFSNLIETLENNTYHEYAIPYYTFFDDEKYVQTIKICSKTNIQYDELLKSFIFKNINECLYESKKMLRLLRENYPDDENISKKYNIYIQVLEQIETYMDMDDVYNKMSNFNI